MNKNATSSPRFIKLETAANQTSMGKSTLLAWEAAGKFPRAVRLSATLRVWLQDDVNHWILEQHAKIADSSLQGQSITTHDNNFEHASGRAAT